MNTKIMYADINYKNKIIKFIKDNWSSDHILIKNEELFDYMYVDNSSINFVVSVNENIELQAILGYVKYSNNDYCDIFLSLWRSLDSSKIEGLKCFEFLINQNYNSISCVGINPKTFNYYKFFNFKIGKMVNYYIINPNFKKPSHLHILNIKTLPKHKKKEQTGYNLIELFEEHEIINTYKSVLHYSGNIKKSVRFFSKKYLHNPFRNYLFYKSKNLSGKTDLLIVMRIFHNENNSCLRIVDIIGSLDLISQCGYAFQKILISSSHEYLDCLIGGVNKSIFSAAGFNKAGDKSNVYIPEYFEPFIDKKTSIFYSTNCNQHYTIFKGDGDQDRPNL